MYAWRFLTQEPHCFRDSAAGMPSDCDHAGRPSSDMMFRSTEISLSPVNSAEPVSISKKMQPADHMSTSAPYLELPSNSSGGLHIGQRSCCVHLTTSIHMHAVGSNFNQPEL